MSAIHRFGLALSVFVLSILGGCDTGDLLDLAFSPPSRKPIDVSKVGVNNFFVNPEFGSIDEQFAEIKNTLGLKYVRILLAWTDGVQGAPNDAPNYSFYDQVIDAIPDGVDALIILAHTPTWITNPANWEDNNPRLTFATRWVRPTVKRYANNPKIVGWELWNEPDLTVVPSDSALELTDPVNYVQLMSFASREVRLNDLGKKVVMGATTSIQQKFPNTIRYNQQLRDLSMETYVDVWGVHYYGSNYESVVTQSGVQDFLNSLVVPAWVTESGQTGPNNQLGYVETAWPFLLDKIPSIERFYYYEFGSTVPVEQNYGLRTTDPTLPVSDLYVHLRSRAGN